MPADQATQMPRYPTLLGLESAQTFRRFRGRIPAVKCTEKTAQHRQCHSQASGSLKDDCPELIRSIELAGEWRRRD